MYAAATYDSLLKTAIEAVQNALDAKAKNVFVGIDLCDRFATIADDGRGVSPEKFAKALMAVGRSQKTRQPDALGKFGLGLISPLDKCKFFEFISRVGRKGEIHAWVFAQDKIKNCETDSQIDELVLKDMPSLEAAFQAEADRIGAVWNTIVRLHDITADRVVSRLTVEKLASDIRTRFGDAMQNHNTTCHLFVRDERGQVQQTAVKPLEYKGEPLDGSPFVIDSSTGEAGKITIELYRAVQSSGKRRGVIRVSDSRGAVYGIPLKEFLAQVKRDLGYSTKNEEGFAELLSGYFEGLVRANLDINVKRDGFLCNQALLDFVIAFDTWYNTVGREFYEGERDRVRDDRYRELMGRSLADVQQVLESRPDFEDTIRAIRDAVELGLETGQGGHSASGNQVLRIKSSAGGGSRDRSPSSSSGQKNKQEKTAGGDGNVGLGTTQRKPGRTAVKGTSLGLTVEVTEFELSNDLWRYDPSAGLISFNSANDVWADLDGASTETRHLYHDHWMVQLQKWGITEVIRMLMLPVDRWEDFAASSRASARLYADMCIKPYKSSQRLTPLA